MNFFGIGGFELVVIVGLAFFLLGPKKMIETSRDAGKIIRELKSERDKFTKMVMEEYEEDDEPDATPRGAARDEFSKPSQPITPEGAVSRPRGRIPPEPEQPSGSTSDGGDEGDERDSPGSGGSA